MLIDTLQSLANRTRLVWFRTPRPLPPELVMKATCILTLWLAIAPPYPQESRPVTLQDLKVPSERLPGGCALAEKASEVSSDGKTRTFLWTGLPIETNPWTGADRQVVSRIRERMDGPAAIPDAPPPTAKELARYRLMLAEGVDEGYVAIYRQSGAASLIVVHALRFATEDGARVSAAAPRFPNPSTIWMTAGPVRAVVSGDGGACFKAIGAYISSLAR
jgi:hypothetical protein